MLSTLGDILLLLLLVIVGAVVIGYAFFFVYDLIGVARESMSSKRR